MFQRVLRGRAATLRLALDGETAGTVTITRDEDGSAVATGPAVPSPEGAEFELEPYADLDLLRVEWDLGADGTAETFVEIVGGYTVTLARLRKLDPLQDEAEYTDADLERGRLIAETALEDACGVAFVPRYRRAKLDGPGGGDLLLPVPQVLAVRSATVDGAELTADDLAALVLYEDEGLAYRPDRWPCGRQNVVLELEHGYRTPPGRVAVAVEQLVRHVLVDSAVDDRAISTTNEQGNVQVFVQAGVRGAVFAIPEANAVVAQYGVRGVG